MKLLEVLLKLPTLLSVAFLFCVSLHSVATEQPLSLNNIHWPPYQFSEPNKGREGLGTDILKRCTEPLNYRLFYETFPVKRTHLFMQRGLLDVTFYSYKSSREEFVRYGNEPIFVSEYGFLAPANSGFDVNSLDDVYSLSLGLLAGLSYTPELMEVINTNKANGLVVESNSVLNLVNELAGDNPSIDLVPNSKETFYWMIKERGLADRLEVLDFTLAQKPYYITVSKASKRVGDPIEFLAQMDSCLKALKQSGEYDALSAKYGLAPLKRN